MKIIVILAILGVGLYMILGSGRPASELQSPSKPKPQMVVTRTTPDLSTPSPIGPATRTTIDPTAPTIDAKAPTVVVVRGTVISVSGDQATLDCDFVPRMPDPEDKPNAVQLTSREASRMAVQLKEDFERETFGILKTADASGRLQTATWTPRQRVQGQVILTGVDIAVGQTVHCQAAPVGVHGDLPVYTARFNPIGPTWMWSNTGRANLERK